MDSHILIKIVAGMVCAFAIALVATPLIRKLSVKIGAIDVPKDDRRMHKEPIPTMGGLAIFIAFAASVLLFVPINQTYGAMLLGALVIVLIGILDDMYTLKWWIKLAGQVGAALIVALNGIQITEMANGDIQLGMWSIPFTILWIVAITNAINLIDGLDGLACGIVGISCIALMIVSTLYMDPQYSIITVVIAVLAGSCFGFLPYNISPAKIFMGDTGAMFIGFTFSVIAIQGFFKLNALVSFGVPFLVLGLPILDTLLAIFRRLLKGQHFFKPDRKHLHHKMLEWGFTLKQTVGLMYAVSALLGLAAILFAMRNYVPAVLVTVGALGGGLLLINWKTRNRKNDDEGDRPTEK